MAAAGNRQIFRERDRRNRIAERGLLLAGRDLLRRFPWRTLAAFLTIAPALRLTFRAQCALLLFALGAWSTLLPFALRARCALLLLTLWARRALLPFALGAWSTLLPFALRAWRALLLFALGAWRAARLPALRAWRRFGARRTPRLWRTRYAGGSLRGNGRLLAGF